MKCSICGVEKDAKGRLPKGWKRKEGQSICKKDWNDLYVLRAITFPVVGPVGEDWKTLREALNQAWADCTRLSNWTVSELAKNDIVRMPDMEKLPPFKGPYLYPQARLICPLLASQSVAALENSVKAKYSKERYERIWLGARSLPSFRYPVPVPIPSQGVGVKYADSRPVASLRIGDRRFDLLLRSGHEFKRQLAGFAELVSGAAECCEASVYSQSVTRSDHRNGVEVKGPSGGRAVMNRVMVKLVGWFPRSKTLASSKTLTVSTVKDSLWVCVIEGADPWIYNADHVRRWQYAHRRRLNRLSDDQKFERRRTSVERVPINETRALSANKYDDRISTFCHTASKELVGFALRHRATHIEYNDAVKTYLPEFQWFKLAALVEQKCRASGIAFASAKVVEETEEPIGTKGNL